MGLLLSPPPWSHGRPLRSYVAVGAHVRASHHSRHVGSPNSWIVDVRVACSHTDAGIRLIGACGLSKSCVAQLWTARRVDSQVFWPNASVVSGMGREGDFHQWLLAFAPRHPIIGALPGASRACPARRAITLGHPALPCVILHCCLGIRYSSDIPAQTSCLLGLCSQRTALRTADAHASALSQELLTAHVRVAP